MKTNKNLLKSLYVANNQTFICPEYVRLQKQTTNTGKNKNSVNSARKRCRSHYKFYIVENKVKSIERSSNTQNLTCDLRTTRLGNK